MPKLYFRHGAVSSAKTLNLLAVVHNYRSQGKSCLLMKPEMDSRFGTDVVKSRAGLEQEADILLSSSTNILSIPRADKLHCVLVDECQFLDPAHIDQLREVTEAWNVPVICYGLRTDFRTHLFPASKRLRYMYSMYWPYLIISFAGYWSLQIALKKWKPPATFATQRLCLTWNMLMVMLISMDPWSSLEQKRNISLHATSVIAQAFLRVTTTYPQLYNTMQTDE